LGIKIILGVTGSVAATLTPKLAQALVDAGHEVKVVSTQRGMYFFEPVCFSDGTTWVLGTDYENKQARLFTDADEWPRGGYKKSQEIPHIDLGKWADAMVIAPLSADTMSDIAHGKADKFLTSLVLAWDVNKPMVIAPAMNTNMWESPITQENLSIIQAFYNPFVVEPVEKTLACGDVGTGAMADIDDIVAAVEGCKE
jgi:phosphopantothenoylcysteine decarboxylase